MPNPLSMMMSAPNTAVKPNPARPEAREPNGAATFQTVMEQETGPQSGEPEAADLLVQELDAESVLEGTDTEGEVLDITVASEDQPPIELHLSKPQTAQHPVIEVQVAKPNSAPIGIVTDAEPVQGGDLRTTIIESQGTETQTAVPPAIQTLILGAAQSNVPAETTRKPQNVVQAWTPAEPRPKQIPELSAFAKPGHDAAQEPPPPRPTTQQPTPPDRAPSVVQMQLMAVEKTAVEADTQPIPEIEDAQAARETSAVQSARDSGAAAQALTTSARAETARAIASQMATAINVRSQSGTIEVALNPEELGRVSIVLNGRDDGLHLTITAERPETLDMMRRHISDLEAEFKNFGLGDLSIDLGNSADTQRDESDRAEDSQYSARNSEQTTDARPTPSRLSPDGRIDMRL